MNQRRKEFCKKVIIYKDDRMKVIRKRLLERFIILKQKTEIMETKYSLEEIKMAKELVLFCESKYGEDFILMNLIDDKKVEILYQVITDFLNEIEKIEKLEKEQKGISNKTIS